MISFSCTRCGMKLKVKPDYAGRSSKCPTCKQPLTVPAVEPTLAAPVGPIDGPASSLHAAGVAAGVTLDPGGPRSGQKPVPELLARRPKAGERYLVEAEIARGGMGAVLRAVDCDIRREVAVKYLLDQTDPAKKLRFVEEAQITGQLEHPNIPPVHELGVDTQKRLFFSMKMVRGRSLAQVLDELRDDSPSAETEYPLGRLLASFVSICHALAYAHSRGVVHRDLKPANVMLGDFGEVYVMDWGLAKVLGREEPAGVPVAVPLPPTAAPPGVSVPIARANQVVTLREADADLTQEGAIIGTPVYMPPEQAEGSVQAIGPRSDVYSLGAILYEVLTLRPPVEPEHGPMAAIVQVLQGKIAPPEQRAPERARAGKVPRELSAVAMKALAHRPEDRYPTVEALRRDIERFLEGRSVSAKADTAHEMVWKLVKRNKLASAFTALLAAVLLWSAWSNWRARLETEAAQQAHKAEMRDAIPAFLRAARLALNDRQLGDALTQLDVALKADRNAADARLLRGQLLIAQKEFSPARAELERYVQLRPDDGAAQDLLRLCRTARGDDTNVFLAFAEVFRRQNEDALVRQMYQYAQRDLAAKRKILPDYERRVQKAWPGVTALTLNETDGTITLNLTGRADVTDLSPLKGMLLNQLTLQSCSQVWDLTPLKDMPLTDLDLSGCSQVRDLAPLKGMPLTELNLTNCGQVRDLAPLKGMPLTSLKLSECAQVEDLAPLKGLPLTTLNLSGCGRVRDLTPLTGMRLNRLSLYKCGQVQDLTPLRGMPLTSLSLEACGQVRDLTPLKGLPLINLDLPPATTEKDLAPLQGMPLMTLSLAGCSQLRDLAPLRGMKLTALYLQSCDQVRDLTPLQGMPLTTLNLLGCNQVRDLAPLKGLPLTRLYLYACDQVRDLSPLRGMSLTEVYLTPKNILQGMDALKQMKSLKIIAISEAPQGKFSPEEFWKKYDAGAFK